jgi:ferritin-like metal-binding protein YciE
MFCKLFSRGKYKEEVIESFINIIKEISFNEDKINLLISDFPTFISEHHYGNYKDYLTIQLYGTVYQINKLECLFISLEKKDMDLIKDCMKKVVNEVRNFYGIAPLDQCCFIPPSLLHDSVKKKIKRIKGC